MMIYLRDFIPAKYVYRSELWKLDGIAINLEKITEFTLNGNTFYIEKDNGKSIRIELAINQFNPDVGSAFLSEVISKYNILVAK